MDTLASVADSAKCELNLTFALSPRLIETTAVSRHEGLPRRLSALQSREGSLTALPNLLEIPIEICRGLPLLPFCACKKVGFHWAAAQGVQLGCRLKLPDEDPNNKRAQH